MSKESINYGLVGYAFGLGGNVPGCSQGPDVLRSRGLLKRLGAISASIVDYGNIGVHSLDLQDAEILKKAERGERSINNFCDTYRCCKALYDSVTKVLTENRLPLIIGGDHSLSIGSVQAVSSHYKKRNKEVGLIWIDTHADVNTPETSPSNNPFGMSVSFLLGRIPGMLSTLGHASPAIRPKNVAYVGLHDLDPGEVSYLRESGITCFTMKEIDILGMAEVIGRAIEVASSSTAGFVSSFDLDVCDPTIAPGIGTPSRGGITYREAHLALELLHESGKMLSFELVELNPILDQNFQTAELAGALLETAIGKTIL